MIDHGRPEDAREYTDQEKAVCDKVFAVLDGETKGMDKVARDAVYGMIETLIRFEITEPAADDDGPADVDVMTPQEKCVTFTMGTLHRLNSEGILSRGDDSIGLTPKGFDAFDKLVESGYRPTDDETRACLIEWLKTDA